MSGVELLCLDWHSFTYHPTHLRAAALRCCCNGLPMRVLLRHTHAQAHSRTSGAGLLCLIWHSFAHHPAHLSRVQVTPQQSSSPLLLSGAGHTAARPVHLIFSRVQVTPQRAQFTSSSLGCRSHRSAPSSPHPLSGAGHTAVCSAHPFFPRTQRARMRG